MKKAQILDELDTFCNILDEDLENWEDDEKITFQEIKITIEKRIKRFKDKVNTIEEEE